MTVWQSRGICGYCYQAAKRITGVCDCGHEGVLPGIINDRPACRTCSNIKLNVDCKSCGAEAELYSGGHCQRCVLTDTVDRLLTSPDTGQITPPLVLIADALKKMERANSGLTWIRQKHVNDFLLELARRPVITHEALDALPPSRTLDYVRGLLVEHHALPQRDELLARYERWATGAQKRVVDHDHRDVIARFIRWGMLRRMRTMDSVSNGTFLRSKQTVTVAIGFCNWLTERDQTLFYLNQSYVDRWQAEGPTTRELVSRFISWTSKAKITPPEITVAPHRRGTTPRMPHEQQRDAIDLAVHSDEMTQRDRLAAILVLVFGQQIEKVVTLTWDDITLTDRDVLIDLAGFPIRLDPPLDQPIRDLVAAPLHSRTAAHPNSSWVFRGAKPGRHIDPAHLRARLKPTFPTLEARLGTLHELTRLAPVAVIAEVLNYSPQTIEKHANASATAYSQYVANRRTSI
ncbi:hypothetical protein [Aeromicrobium sp.]|uniref:hypothetical protein n=1 Tax=Aeromicrobium sp. TaxID=1871063 RepID=UPI0025BC0D5C|nr:hypothetical protein [Aeromicrobium sp.]